MRQNEVEVKEGASVYGFEKILDERFLIPDQARNDKRKKL